MLVLFSYWVFIISFTILWHCCPVEWFRQKPNWYTDKTSSKLTSETNLLDFYFNSASISYDFEAKSFTFQISQISICFVHLLFDCWIRADIDWKNCNISYCCASCNCRFRSVYFPDIGKYLCNIFNVAEIGEDFGNKWRKMVLQVLCRDYIGACLLYGVIFVWYYFIVSKLSSLHCCAFIHKKHFMLFYNNLNFVVA